jgi:hypothetical protein
MKIAIANGKEMKDGRIMDRPKLITTDTIISIPSDGPSNSYLYSEIANIVLLSLLKKSQIVSGGRIFNSIFLPLLSKAPILLSS